MVITLTQRQAELTERLRTLLFVEPSTRERSMFGCLSFMVRDKMVVAALKDGDLLVRVPADQHDELTEHPGASRAENGCGTFDGIRLDTGVRGIRRHGRWLVVLAHRSLGPQPVTRRALTVAEFRGFPPEMFAFFEALADDNSKEFWNTHKRLWERDIRDPMHAMLGALEVTSLRPSSSLRMVC